MSTKLVRDNICSILEEAGYKVSYRVLDDDEFRYELIRKLHEETDEYEENFSVWELADIIEVLISIVNQSGFTAEEINKAVESKRERNGGFRKKIFLESFKEEATE